MKICVIMVDTRTDGSRPVDCDIRMDGMTIVLTLPKKLDMELVMLKDDIKKLLEENE